MKEVKNLAIFFHGYGGNKNSLQFLLKHLEKQLTGYGFVFLDGVEVFEKNCDVSGKQRQWFSLLDLNLKILQDKIESNLPIIRRMIVEAQAEFGLSNKNTVLLGFSQGAMLSQYIALSEEHEPFNAVVSFNGALVPPKDICNTKTPIALISGGKDEVISEAYYEQNCEYLNLNLVTSRKILIKDLGHKINQESVNFCCDFLRDINKHY